MRKDKAGREVGRDSVDPLLWPQTKEFLLQGKSHEQVLALLDEFIAKDADKLIKDPLKRAVAFAKALARRALLSWEGIGDADGNPAGIADHRGTIGIPTDGVSASQHGQWFHSMMPVPESTIAPPHHTPWRHAMDDSLESYLQSSEAAE